MYKAKVIKWPFNKTYICKGHKIIGNRNTMLILENENRVFIPETYIIEFDQGWFKMEMEAAKAESQGKAEIKSGV